MPSTSIVCGVLLILIGIVGYVNGQVTGHSSITALIPAFFGIVLAGLGLAARQKENLRKHLMHAAVVVALLGFIATAGRLISKLGDLSYEKLVEKVSDAAVVSQVSMALVCLLFVVLAVKSFADARKKVPTS